MPRTWINRCTNNIDSYLLRKMTDWAGKVRSAGVARSVSADWVMYETWAEGVSVCDLFFIIYYYNKKIKISVLPSIPNVNNCDMAQ